MNSLKLAAGMALALTVPAQAVHADSVNVYSYRQPELVQPLFDRFTAETGITVNLAFLEKGMVERLKAEGKRTPADVILTSDFARLMEAVEEGVTGAVQSGVLDAAIPATLRGESGTWYGLTRRARVVYSSKDRVGADVPATYEELADPKWKGRICIRSGTHPYNLALTAAMVEHHGEDYAKAWLEGMRANLARRPQGNDRAQVKAIWAGECDIAIGNTYYMGKMLANEEQRAWADAVTVVFPRFEGGGTHVNVSGMAITAHAPNPDAARQLMEFLASDAAQTLYAEVNYEYPVVEGASVSALVASWGSFTADGIALSSVAAQRPVALRLVQTVDFDG